MKTAVLPDVDEAVVGAPNGELSTQELPVVDVAEGAGRVRSLPGAKWCRGLLETRHSLRLRAIWLRRQANSVKTWPPSQRDGVSTCRRLLISKFISSSYGWSTRSVLPLSSHFDRALGLWTALPGLVVRLRSLGAVTTPQ